MAPQPLTRTPAPPASLEPAWFGRPFSMPIGVVAQKVIDADLNRLGVWLAANAPSQGAAAAVTNPATTTNVCSIGGLAPGLYDVTSTVCFVGGTAVVTTDSTNWRLVIGKASAGTGQTVATLSCPIANSQPQSRVIRVSMPGGGGDLFLASIATPTSGVIYQGDLAATPLTPVFVGVDSLVTGALGFTGWPIGPTPQFFGCNQELWAVAPIAGAAGSLPAILSVWEVRRHAPGGATIPYEGN